MNATTERRRQAVVQGIDALHRRACSAQQGLLVLIAEADRQRAWHDSGARDLAHWLQMRCGISNWKARRWIAAAHALERLPRTSEAFSSGELGIDKVVELTRFATTETEGDLIRWGKRVSCWAIRRKGDLAVRPSIDETRDAERARSLAWWYFEENRRFGLQAELPAADGAVVARALERLAETLPAMPGEEGGAHVDARRADALVALCSSRIASDADPDRATVVVHAQLDGVASGEGGCELEGGPVIHPETARRLLCDARVQTVIEGDAAQPVGLGRMSREPSAWMMRQLKYRDLECRFPGCGSSRFTQAHHVRWWEDGGSTDLDNLLLVCTFHHKLVHEFGWSVTREENGIAQWFRPDGSPYRAGPAPPREPATRARFG
ncbi:MAG TPA: DUF222 domain-containing protein [Actinomycetota bacterium]|nr:DUF222 domain-containing protein [Actinomycetota bacterium]